MKPKRPRINLKPPNFRIPALFKIAKPHGTKNMRLYIGAGAFAIVALGALGWLVVRRAPPPPAAAAANVEPVPDVPKLAKPDSRAIAAETPIESTTKTASEAEQAPTQKQREARGAEAQPVVAAPPPAPPSEIEALVRRLQDLQERVAGGDADSYAEMPRLFQRIAQRLREQPSEVWAQKANTRALVLYLLSGGQSTLGRKILSAQTMAPTEQRLAKGAIAYLEGVDCPERDALLELDPRALDPALGAQVAFVQAILLASVDRQKALAQLDLARLLGPGGLVEEAALRREIGLLSETSDFDKFAALARQYWSRFRHSPYAENFLGQFVGAIARVSVLVKPEQWEQIDEFIDSLTEATRRGLYLAAAQTAAVAGNSAFADLAAQRAFRLSAPDSVERQRALLYRAAALVVGAAAAQCPTILREVDRDALPAADRPLYDAAALSSARIFRVPERDFAAPPADAGDLSGGELARAETGLREADAAIAAARRSMERLGR